MNNNLERILRQSKPIGNSYTKASLGLIVLAKQVESQMQAFFKKYNLTFQQFNTLKIIKGQLPNTCNILTIKERMIDKQSDVSRMLDRMQRNGWIIKEFNLTDKRYINVIITDKALDLISEIEPLVQKHVEILNSFSNTEIEQLNLLIDSALENC
ncbi:MAG: MarR family transcriptional regulator [Chitinophagaceae bacterium]